MIHKNGVSTIAVAGAGPAGLAAAYEFARRGAKCTVFEQDTQVGGLAKTVTHSGYRYDIGPHRFYTKCKEVERLWRELLPEDFLRIPRQTRIYYRDTLFNYPLTPFDALRGLGLTTSLLVFASYAYSRILPKKPAPSMSAAS